MLIDAQHRLQRRNDVPRNRGSVLSARSIAEPNPSPCLPIPKQHIASSPALKCVGVGRLDRLGTLVPFSRGSQLYSENDPALYLYRLVSGLARGCRVTTEGHRQILAFYTPGELFGFELGIDHAFTVEAVSNLRVRMIKRSIIAERVPEDGDVAAEIRSGLGLQLRRSQEHILRLGKNAQERVADFLLEIAERVPGAGIFGLPIPRQDIADYLGITIETVSRTLTLFRCAAAIAPQGRKIIICNSETLKRFLSKCG